VLKVEGKSTWVKPHSITPPGHTPPQALIFQNSIKFSVVRPTPTPASTRVKFGGEICEICGGVKS